MASFAFDAAAWSQQFNRSPDTENKRPEWENARKALEAMGTSNISPKKKSGPGKSMENNLAAAPSPITQQEQNHNNYYNNQQFPGPGIYQARPRYPFPPFRGGYGGTYRPNCSENSMSRPQCPPMYGNEHQTQRFQNQSNNYQFNQSRKQAPGSAGIRFQIPKKSNIKPSNAMAQTQPLKHFATPNNQNRPHPYRPPPPENIPIPPTAPDQHKSNDGSDLFGGCAAGEWPKSLKVYVQRAFSTFSHECHKDQIESILKERLTQAFNSGDAWKIDWDNEPLPNIDDNNKLRMTPKKSRWGNDTGNHKTRGRGRGFGAQRGMRSIYNHDLVPTYRHSRSRSYSSSSRSKSRSKSPPHSRSRSRSRSPFGRRRSPRKLKKRRGSSSDRSDCDKGMKKGRYIIGGRGRQTRGRGVRGRGRGRNMSSQNTPNNDIKKGVHLKSGLKGMNFHDPDKAVRLQKRAARFGDQLEDKTPSKNLRQKITMGLNLNNFNTDSNDADLGSFEIVGTCQDLEKQYLRLTSAPDAKTIRPVDILKKSLLLVQNRWKEKPSYHFTCEQLKSIRQDLTVQGIRDEFTVKVYETHARIAMEKADHEEFNQCQTQLKLLYQEGIDGNKVEFTAYRILYYIFTSNSLDMTTALSLLKASDHQDICIKHSLKVRSAWACNNYHNFFKLYSTAPKMSAYLMDWFVERVRKTAIKAIVKSFRPMIPLQYISAELAFSNLDDCVDFLKEKGATFNTDKSKLDCKSSNTVIQAL